MRKLKLMDHKVSEGLVKLKSEVNKATVEGVMAAIKAFADKHGVNVTPGTLSDNVLAGFANKLTAEFGYAQHEYPFLNSYFHVWRTMQNELGPIIVKLVESGEEARAPALARTIMFSETLLFLENIKGDVKNQFKSIRGEDKGKLQDPLVLE